ncbi:ribosomal RNA large subunit methyltransferaseK/L [Striga asiatica]|uniref:Ribosomal RNA large subunit methyltransferaseK/L n=1 Tax=Striga asiatica TaxID=4170 RepID=A0A5A7P7I9_STRAF|nr:ribosomal RNA large subunit methyltransferaseK/L [Striga asiatica]
MLNFNKSPRSYLSFSVFPHSPARPSAASFHAALPRNSPLASPRRPSGYLSVAACSHSNPDHCIAVDRFSTPPPAIHVEKPLPPPVHAIPPPRRHHRRPTRPLVPTVRCLLLRQDRPPCSGFSPGQPISRSAHLLGENPITDFAISKLTRVPCCCTFPIIPSDDAVGANAKQKVPDESTGIMFPVPIRNASLSELYASVCSLVTAVPESTMTPPLPSSPNRKVSGDAHPNQIHVVEGVQLRVPNQRRRHGVGRRSRVELQRRRRVGVAVDKAVGEGGGVDLRGERQGAAAQAN